MMKSRKILSEADLTQRRINRKLGRAGSRERVLKYSPYSIAPEERGPYYIADVVGNYAYGKVYGIRDLAALEVEIEAQLDEKYHR